MNKLFLVAVVAMILIVNVLRFMHLESVPPGGQVDELSASVTLQCLASEGVDAHGRPYPLFGDLHYGSPLSPVHLYAGMGWVKLFGSSVSSLRSLAGVYLILGIIGLFFLARFMFGGACAVWVVFTASLSPWVWSLSRVAFESLSSLPLFILGLFFLLRSGKVRDSVVAGVLLALGMYAYPPMRVLIPLVIALIWGLRIFRRSFQWRSALTLFFVMGALLIPLGQLLMSSSFTRRFNEISIFREDLSGYTGTAQVMQHWLGVFWSNFLAHLSPVYLFIQGGGNGINLARGSGIFSWHEALGLAVCLVLFIRMTGAVIFRRAALRWNEAGWCGFLLCCFLLGILPVAVTNSDLPNSLRMIGSWPFGVLLAGYGLWRLAESFRPAAWGILLLALTFSSVYLNDYFKNYSQYAGGWYKPWVKEQALAAKTDIEWLEFAARNIHEDYHVRYYLMQYHKDSCSSSRAVYEAVFRHMRACNIF